MSVSLRQKFKGKEAYVVNLVNQMGYESVMRLYDVKHRKTFLRWYAENSNSELPHNPLEGLSRGEKHKWCVEHLDTIVDCIGIFGEDWVKANFHFTHDTLYSLIRFGKYSYSNRAIHKELEGMHNHLENIKFRLSAEHLDYVDSIERMRQLEIAVVGFAQMIASQLGSALTPAIEEVFKVKPRRLKKGAK